MFVNRKYVLLGTLIILLVSCKRDRNHPGYSYYPDMAFSQAYETWSENDVWEDRRTMREPVKGTVPREMIPYFLEKNKDDRVKAGSVFMMHQDTSQRDISRGKELYDLVCMQCHGEKGNGKGKLHLEGWYGYPPASLVNEKMKAVPDGEIYHVITAGYNLMGSQGSILRPAERWEVVRYVRGLQEL